MKAFTTALLLLSALFTAAGANPPDRVITGAEQLFSNNLHLLHGKHLGIVTNHTALLPDGTHLVDSLFHTSGITITALFGPEHGFRGNTPAGEKIDSNRDPITGITVYSLYGKNNKPTAEMLKGIDLLLFDIQDAGARFYTYISTLYYTIEAGAELNIPVLVLDRPNPIGGELVEGAVLPPELYSFVGITKLPIVHGMTIGELARYYSAVLRKEKNLSPDVTVLAMQNWKRAMVFPETGLAWVNPSPNIPHYEAAAVYPGACLIEATNVSEGRGTYAPFITIGAPFINAEAFTSALRKAGLAGCKMEPAVFTPETIPGKASKPKHEGIACGGVRLRVTNPQVFSPVRLGVTLLCVLQQLYPTQFEIKAKSMARLSGDPKLAENIMKGMQPAEIIDGWQTALNEFKLLRTAYLLY